MKESIKAFLKKITFAKSTAFLLALTVLLGLFAYFESDPFWMNERIAECKENLASDEELLKSLQKDKADTQQKYDGLKKESEEKIAELEDAEKEANDALDKMCSEDKFHASSRYYDCYDNDFKCKSLHSAVEEAEKALSEYKETSKKQLESYENQLNTLENQISSATERIASLKEEITELKKDRLDAVFALIGVLVTMAGLGAFAAYLFLEKGLRVLGLGACGATALGAVLMLFATDFPFLLHPFFYTVVIFALFALIIWTDGKKNPVPARVCAVVFAVIELILLLAFSGAILTTLLYVLSVILAAFVLVPIDFKEYIKIAKHIFLCFITFGIWIFVWIFNVTKNLNKVEALEKRKPVNELLLCMFLPFYFAYWLYKNAEYIEFYGAEKNVTMNKISILCFILGFFCPLLSIILMQDKINQIVGKPAPAEEIAPAEAPAE